MKKNKYIILMCFIFLLTGCVKSNTTMTINKDKSMSLSSDILISDKINNESSKLIIKDEKDKLQKRGITVENIDSSNGYSGFSVTKKYDDIDKVSSETSKEINISDFLSEDFDDSILFQVKKGMFKNIYTANYKFEVNDDYSDLESDNNTASGNIPAEEVVPNTTVDTNNNANPSTNLPDDTTDTSTDLMNLMSEMEFKYVVKLPYKALESNSTIKSDGDKTLEWNLNSNETVIINYSFELYNMNNIYMMIGISIGVILLFIILIIIKNKIVQKKRDRISKRPILKEYDPSIESELFETNNLNNSVDVNNSVNDEKEINTSEDNEELEKTQIINIPDDVK